MIAVALFQHVHITANSLIARTLIINANLMVQQLSINHNFKSKCCSDVPGKVLLIRRHRINLYIGAILSDEFGFQRKKSGSMDKQRFCAKLTQHIYNAKHKMFYSDALARIINLYPITN